MQKFTRAWKPQLSLVYKTGSYHHHVGKLPRPLKTIAPIQQLFFSTKSTTIATEPTTTTTTSAPAPTPTPITTDPALMEYRQYINKVISATTAAKASTAVAIGNNTTSSIDNSMIHQLWHHYEKIQGNPGLTREDYTNIRGILWKNKLWGSEDRLLQLLNDMEQQGHGWTVLEYNEYFLVKLYQARYQDILDMYDGGRTFEALGIKMTVATLNALLATFIKLDLEPQAEQLIKEAGDRWGVVPDIRDFDKSMRRCMPRDTDVKLKGRQWIAQYGFDQVHVVDTNLQHLFRDKLIDDGIWVYEQLGQTQPLAPSTYTLLLRNLIDAKKLRLAADIYDDMVKRGGAGNINPTICSAMLILYAHRRQVDKAETAVRDMVKAGHAVDEVIYNQLIKVYFKSRQTRKALLAFEELQRHPNLKLNEVILNTMVDGLVMNREIQAAHHLYKQILANARTNIKPDMVTFNTLFKGFVKAKQYDLAGGVIRDMHKYHCAPDTVTFTTLIDSIFEYKQPQSANELMTYVEKGMGMTPNIYTFNAMINGWVRRGNMDEAENTLAVMQLPAYKVAPTIHTMTNMIQGYVEISNLPKAMQTFQHCVSRGIKPDRAAYNFLITGFMDYDRIDDAVVCLQHMRKANLNPTKDTWNMLLDACVRKQQWSTGALLVKEIDASGFAITNPALRRNYLRLKNSS